MRHPALSDPALGPTSRSPEHRIAAVGWHDGAPVVIDQRRLPSEVVVMRLETIEAVIDAIRTLAVRGAPAIGIAGAYGVALAARRSTAGTPHALRAEADAIAERIGAARPTAVNLALATARVARAARSAPDDLESIRVAALDEALAIHDEDAAASAAIGRHGAAYLGGTRRLLTHCNTGRLATGGDGTALAIVYALHAEGRLASVIATESRPLLQGGRLTTWELAAAGVPTRLIVDSAAGAAMSAGLVDAVVVGCDRVAANGDTANKIGTYQLAVLARHHGIPFVVAGPRTSFDAATRDGAAIVIEERAADEVRGFGGSPVAPADIDVWNPAFDVTPASLIDAFITDAGVHLAPYEQSLREVFG
jgi:methylthioribose-1-phosphate isomerase